MQLPVPRKDVAKNSLLYVPRHAVYIMERAGVGLDELLLSTHQNQ